MQGGFFRRRVSGGRCSRTDRGHRHPTYRVRWGWLGDVFGADREGDEHCLGYASQDLRFADGWTEAFAPVDVLAVVDAMVNDFGLMDEIRNALNCGSALKMLNIHDLGSMVWKYGRCRYLMRVGVGHVGLGRLTDVLSNYSKYHTITFIGICKLWEIMFLRGPIIFLGAL